METMPLILPKSESDEIWVTEFNPQSAQEFRDRVLEEAKKGPDRPIVIYIDSYGGQVDSLAKMIATLDEVSNPIVTCCMGKAMSCGAMLLAHGDVRFCDSHSRIMVHKVSAMAMGNVDDIVTDTEEISRLNEYWMNVLATDCGIKGGYQELSEILRSKDGHERYFTPQEAKTFGLIDIIGLPKVVADTVYDVATIPVKTSPYKESKWRAKYRSEPEKKAPQTKTLKKSKTKGAKK